MTSHALTFDLDLGRGLDRAELGGGDAGVVVGVADVGEHQDVLAERLLVVAAQLARAEAPLDLRQRRARRRARQVRVASGHHLHRLGLLGEEGRHAPHCKIITERRCYKVTLRIKRTGLQQNIITVQ